MPAKLTGALQSDVMPGPPSFFPLFFLFLFFSFPFLFQVHDVGPLHPGRHPDRDLRQYSWLGLAFDWFSRCRRLHAAPWHAVCHARFMYCDHNGFCGYRVVIGACDPTVPSFFSFFPFFPSGSGYFDISMGDKGCCLVNSTAHGNATGYSDALVAPGAGRSDHGGYRHDRHEPVRSVLPFDRFNARSRQF